MPRVSIITRTKNRLVFLARSLLSVQQQGFTDWEIVIVNIVEVSKFFNPNIFHV